MIFTASSRYFTFDKVTKNKQTPHPYRGTRGYPALPPKLPRRPTQKAAVSGGTRHDSSSDTPGWNPMLNSPTRTDRQLSLEPAHWTFPSLHY